MILWIRPPGRTDPPDLSLAAGARAATDPGRPNPDAPRGNVGKLLIQQGIERASRN